MLGDLLRGQEIAEVVVPVFQVLFRYGNVELIAPAPSGHERFFTWSCDGDHSFFALIYNHVTKRTFRISSLVNNHCIEIEQSNL